MTEHFFFSAKGDILDRIDLEFGESNECETILIFLKLFIYIYKHICIYTRVSSRNILWKK